MGIDQTQTSKWSEGICPNIANHREQNSKVLVNWGKVLRWFLIDLVLYNHAKIQIYMIYVIWESEGVTIINWRSGKNLTS